MSGVRVTDLHAGYGKGDVLRGVSLHVEPGEVVALIGGNGAGKSTLLLCMAGLLAASRGEVEILGGPPRPLHHMARAGLAYIPEGRSVFSALSVNANMRIGAASPGDAYALAPELVAMKGRAAGMLSGGEQQLLTVARALAARPKLVLADEVSLGLSPQIAARVLQLLRARANEGAAVLVVEQQARRALAVADRALVMRRGEIVEQGASSDLLSEIADLSAAYLGVPTT